MFCLFLEAPLAVPPFNGPIHAFGLDSLWTCGTARSLSLNLKKSR
ncbi:hypothetical protein KR009_008832, partial [Drosophila setifemur]